MLAAVLLVVFPFSMAFAAFSDLVSMTISNRIPIVLSISFLALALVTGMPYPTIALHLLVGILCLAITFGFFAAGWMGGGDAKLIATTALWLGPTASLLEYLFVGSILGGMLTLGLLMARANMVPATGIDFVDHLLERETGIPYGIALGAAGLIAYTSSAWLDLALQPVL
ncbi:A24 family peptidase [Mangrovicella endophytica]|uniref:A24 family peptidase n=1 Tax=Mangrovicella endophytica TaxID=2066697 RepID=UPI000C9E8F32|nr:prepilin peptidase [Mangrovicella endophytica]